MIRLNFREACLLDASGELGPAARREFLEYIRQNPAACLEYEEIRREFELLRGLPLTGQGEVSPRQRRKIPAQLKAVIERHMREKRAIRRTKLIRYAWMSVASAAAAIAIVIGAGLPQLLHARARERDQVARIQADIDRMAVRGDQPTTYDQAVTDVEASIRQLETESPSLAEVNDRSMGNLLSTLATISPDTDDSDISNSLALQQHR